MTKTRSEYIESSAEYLRDKRLRDAQLAGLSTGEDMGISKREELISKLKDAQKLASRLRASLEPLEREMQVQGLPDEFSLTVEHLQGAWREAVSLEARLKLALQEGTSNARTKSKVYHQAAAKLAVAYDNKNARQLAHDIIKAAGDLETDYSEQSMDNWLRSARREL